MVSTVKAWKSFITGGLLTWEINRHLKGGGGVGGWKKKKKYCFIIRKAGVITKLIECLPKL